MTGSDGEQDVFRRHATSVNVPPRLSSLGRMNTLASWAGQLARELLQQSLPRRWAHVQGVAARARGLASVLGADADLLEAAAWLHDIGYAPGLATTGLHALDGARFLRDAQDADEMLCRLVAHHSCAIIEAEERGLGDVLSLEFEPAPQALSSVLTFCDMTTSPDGEPVTVGRRLAEIHHRYGSGHLVSRSIQRATPMILCAVEQVQDRAAEAHSSADRKERQMLSRPKQSELATLGIAGMVHVDGTVCQTDRPADLSHAVLPRAQARASRT
jgi:putative nucleotidyltransferase with HDIG domain